MCARSCPNRIGVVYPGWATVTESEWRDAQWQRAHSVKNIAQLRAVTGDLLDERFYIDLAADQQQRATMSMLLPPQMLNTMAPTARWNAEHTPRPSMPIRSALHAATAQRSRAGMGLTSFRRARFVARERHVGGGGADTSIPDQGPRRNALDLPTILRALHADGSDRQFHTNDQQEQAYPAAGRPAGPNAGLPAAPHRRCVMSWCRRGCGQRSLARLESFVMQLLEIDTIRDIRLATKALAALPQH